MMTIKNKFEIKLTLMLLTTVIILFSCCSPIYKFKHKGEYNINSKGDTCLPCKNGYIFKNDSCYLNIKPSKLY